MTLTTVTTPIARDRYSRPLVTPPDGGKPIAYTRTTTYVGCLEDTYNLSRWQQRMVAIGLADRPDLVLAVAAHRDHRNTVQRACDDALEAAKGRAAATTGTALHALTELVDTDKPLPQLDKTTLDDMAAYKTATAALTVCDMETFCVQDDLQIGGTPDRIVEYNGRRHIADLKTGSIKWGAGKIAMQLAVYAHSVKYDHTTNTRTPLDVDLDRAIVIHLPAGTGEATLAWADIRRGWDAVQVATQVREWRKAKGLLTPVDVPDACMAALATASTVAELEDTYHQFSHSWTDVHTSFAAERKAAINNDTTTVVSEAQAGAAA